MIEVSDKTTYYNNRNLRLRSKLQLEEIERDWVNWIVDEEDRIDVLRIAAAMRRIHARKVAACAAVETSPPSPLSQTARGNQDRVREK